LRSGFTGPVRPADTFSGGGQMSWTEGFRSAASGTRVEVRSKFDQQWVGGFEVAEEVAEPGPGYRIRRRSDRSVLPVVFAPEDVRVDRTTGRG
jgi:hypothetical protein